MADLKTPGRKRRRRKFVGVKGFHHQVGRSRLTRRFANRAERRKKVS
jgi:hypothetical protein